jgi:hypothetical protein
MVITATDIPGNVTKSEMELNAEKLTTICHPRISGMAFLWP